MSNPKERAVRIVSITGTFLKGLSESMRDDEEVVSAAVMNTGMALEYASPRLRADKRIALLAVKSVGMAITFVEGEAYQDKEVIYAAIRSNPCVYNRVLVRPDLATTKFALSCDGCLLGCTPGWMQDSKEIVLLAIEQDPFAIKHASPRLRGDEDVAMEAVRSGMTLKYVSNELTNHKPIVLKAVASHYGAYTLASEQLRRDPEVLLKAVEHLSRMPYEEVDLDERFLAYIPDDVLEEQVEHVVGVYGQLWKYLPSRFKGREDLARKALQTCGAVLEHFPAEWKDDESFVLAAVRQDGLALEEASQRLRSKRDVVMEALSSKGCALQHASYALREDEDVVLHAVKNDPYALMFSFVFTYKVVLPAIAAHRLAIGWCPLSYLELPLVQYAAGICDNGEEVAAKLKSVEEKLLLSDVAALKGDEDLVAFLEHPDSDIGVLRKRQFEEAFFKEEEEEE